MSKTRKYTVTLELAERQVEQLERFTDDRFSRDEATFSYDEMFLSDEIQENLELIFYEIELMRIAK